MHITLAVYADLTFCVYIGYCCCNKWILPWYHTIVELLDMRRQATKKGYV